MPLKGPMVLCCVDPRLRLKTLVEGLLVLSLLWSWAAEVDCSCLIVMRLRCDTLLLIGHLFARYTGLELHVLQC